MPKEYLTTVGLEIHAELKTKTKMFCDCLNDPAEAHPNTNICPICTGQPGTLPTVNKKAVEHVLRVGLALGGKIASTSKFDRKNYFYPDLPKGYQISQYDEPFVSGGKLEGVHITRIHLEEDAGSLGHEKDKNGNEVTLVDYNRAGRPLMELVTEPDITTSEQAVNFATELQRILRYLEASDADMEHGQMRVEANISVRENGAIKLGTKVEVKNLNSFKVVALAIKYEVARQIELLERGGKIIQETRGWDENNSKTASQRLKEEAHDYRYFPEPDIPLLFLPESGFDIEKLKMELPELPQAKAERFMREYNLSEVQARVMVADKAMAEYYEEALSELATEEGGKTSEARALLFNYFTSDFWGLLKEAGMDIKETKVTPENFADLIILIATGQLSSRTAKDILAKMMSAGSDPREIMAQENLGQISDEKTLEVIAFGILQANPKVLEDYKKGKLASLQFLVGKAMGQLKGRANATVLQEIFKRLMK